MTKQVSNEEFVRMFGNLDTPHDKLTTEQKDNHLTMRKVTNLFTNILSEEEIKSCMLQATLRCLKHHEDGKGNKFTTSLWRFIDWECKRELTKKLKSLNNQPVSIDEFDHFDFVIEEKNEEAENLHECIGLLPEPYQELIREYYFDKYTMEEIGSRHNYTKEAARQKINKAISKLREIYISQS